VALCALDVRRESLRNIRVVGDAYTEAGEPSQGGVSERLAMVRRGAMVLGELVASAALVGGVFNMFDLMRE
jgi:hypothetical protein